MAESYAAGGLECLEVRAALRRTAVRFRLRILEDTGGGSSSAQAGGAEPAGQNGCGRSRESQQTDGDERHQNGGPRVGKFRRLLRRHQSLHDSDEPEGRAGNRFTLRALLGVLIQQSQSLNPRRTPGKDHDKPHRRFGFGKPRYFESVGF